MAGSIIWNLQQRLSVQANEYRPQMKSFILVQVS
jgi:hypothetical protein